MIWHLLSVFAVLFMFAIMRDSYYQHARLIGHKVETVDRVMFFCICFLILLVFYKAGLFVPLITL